MQAEATPQPAVTETLIDGWRLLRQIASSDGVRERYLAEHAESARQAVLTLYRPGAEPDPAIYDVIRRLPREHVPEILATGRWDERAYEVVEELTGGSLADLGTAGGPRGGAPRGPRAWATPTCSTKPACATATCARPACWCAATSRWTW